ncbi:uncharacterized protein LOC125040746 [Penaeus chinensis]|uniref:uncharacterized protein LOC125040746 n=1 Tax=Penaeus chinensis TaxID=139456 RepID=UPI001FB747BB|nr:uncharacterized protein LOC125040746 [Penaeus chinensis]
MTCMSRDTRRAAILLLKLQRLSPSGKVLGASLTGFPVGSRGTTKITTMINRTKVILEMAVLAIVVPFGLLYGIKHIKFAPSRKYQVEDTRSFDESRGEIGLSLGPRGNSTSPRGIFATFLKTRDDPGVKPTEIFGEMDRFRGETQGTPAKELNILLLSSVGRSGSSMFGELLAQMPNSLYFFEPLMFYQKHTSEGVQPRTTFSILQKIYSCAWDPGDALWASFGADRSLARQNGRQPVCVYESGKRTLNCLRNTCLRNTNIVVKVIRMRVAWLSALLSAGKPSVRVVHLVRDPRGSFLSLKRQDMRQKNPREWCPAILQPRTTFSILQKIYSCAWDPGDALWASFGADRSSPGQNGRQPVCVYESGKRTLNCLRNTCLRNTNIVVKVIGLLHAGILS